jgi:Fe-S-cluster containining protein
LSTKLLQPFYENGLHFECTQCSTCCRHTPGYVFLSKNDIASLLEATKKTFSQFFRQYCRIVPTFSGTKISLIEKPNFDCIFWNDNGCIYYDYRPFQCRSFPFWKSYLVSLNKWMSLKSFCPGIDRGNLHTEYEIKAWIENGQKEEYYYAKGDIKKIG